MKKFLGYHLSARTEKTLSWQVGGWGPWTVDIGDLVLFEVPRHLSESKMASKGMGIAGLKIAM